MYHTLAYYKSSTAGATLADIPAVADGSISTRNGHFIFTEDYELAMASAWGVNLTQVQFNDSSWNAINIPQIYPVNLAITPPSLPIVQDMRSWPVQIPQNEEIAVQASNNAAIYADPEYVICQIAPRGVARTLPAPMGPAGSMGRVRALATFTTAITAGVWSSDANIVFNSLLKGGTYCIVGAYVFVPHALAWRINFVRAPLYQGRKLFPGGLVENAYGNYPLVLGDEAMGPVGYFDTFELPLMQILASTTEASATYNVIFDMIYVSQNMLASQPYRAA